MSSCNPGSAVQYGFKKPGTDVITHFLAFNPTFIFDSHFGQCQIFLLRSVIITVLLVRTLTHTQPAPPRGSTILYLPPQRGSKDMSVCHRWLIGVSWSSGWVKSAWRWTRGFSGVIFSLFCTEVHPIIWPRCQNPQDYMCRMKLYIAFFPPCFVLRNTQ